MPFNHLFVRCALATALLASSRLLAQDPLAEAAQRAAAAHLRPGDHIELQFRQDRELNASIIVNERGEAVFPKLGSLQVGSITIAGLPDTLRSLYSVMLRNPDMDVSVSRRVTVNGEVRQPNVYMLDVNSTVRDAIAHAGGLLETSNKNDVVIVRGNQRIRVKNWEQDTGPQSDLMSGDQVLVGRKAWLVLNALPVISTSVIVVGLIRSLRH